MMMARMLKDNRVARECFTPSFIRGKKSCNLFLSVVILYQDFLTQLEIQSCYYNASLTSSIKSLTTSFFSLPVVLTASIYIV